MVIYEQFLNSDHNNATVMKTFFDLQKEQGYSQ